MVWDHRTMVSRFVVTNVISADIASVFDLELDTDIHAESMKKKWRVRSHEHRIIRSEDERRSDVHWSSLRFDMVYDQQDHLVCSADIVRRRTSRRPLHNVHTRAPLRAHRARQDTDDGRGHVQFAFRNPRPSRSCHREDLPQTPHRRARHVHRHPSTTPLENNGARCGPREVADPDCVAVYADSGDFGYVRSASLDSAEKGTSVTVYDRDGQTQIGGFTTR